MLLNLNANKIWHCMLHIFGKLTLSTKYVIISMQWKDWKIKKTMVEIWIACSCCDQFQIYKACSSNSSVKYQKLGLRLLCRLPCHLEISTEMSLNSMVGSYIEFTTERNEVVQKSGKMARWRSLSGGKYFWRKNSVERMDVIPREWRLASLLCLLV